MFSKCSKTFQNLLQFIKSFVNPRVEEQLRFKYTYFRKSVFRKGEALFANENLT